MMAAMNALLPTFTQSQTFTLDDYMFDLQGSASFATLDPAHLADLNREPSTHFLNSPCTAGTGTCSAVTTTPLPDANSAKASSREANPSNA